MYQDVKFFKPSAVNTPAWEASSEVYIQRLLNYYQLRRVDCNPGLVVFSPYGAYLSNSPNARENLIYGDDLNEMLRADGSCLILSSGYQNLLRIENETLCGLGFNDLHRICVNMFPDVAVVMSNLLVIPREVASKIKIAVDMQKFLPRDY